MNGLNSTDMTNEEITKIIEEAEWQQESFHRVSGDLSKRMIKALKQVHKYDIIDLVSVLSDLKEWCFDNCNASNSDRLHEILDRLDKR
mgnify:CR=1 FL=1